jgi:hypothetical protein
VIGKPGSAGLFCEDGSCDIGREQEAKMAKFADQTHAAEELSQRESQQPASQATREEALRRLEKFRGRLPEDFVFDRDEANLR